MAKRHTKIAKRPARPKPALPPGGSASPASAYSVPMKNRSALFTKDPYGGWNSGTPFTRAW